MSMSERDDIRCQEVVAHLLHYLDGEIDAEKRVQIDRHLRECRGCCSRAAFEKSLRDKVRQLGHERASAALHRRIDSLIDEF
jgi:mycothiol system anti-sigma-R factor